MIGIVLAAGLGVANFIIVALLFRRDRQLSRQLSDMRAERNSEWILRALKEAGAPEERAQIAPAATGDYYEPSVAGLKPVRRKKHLILFLGGGSLLGGGSAAALAALRHAVHRAWQRHPEMVMAGVVATAVLATTALILAGARGQDGAATHAPPATTATPTPAPPTRPSRVSGPEASPVPHVPRSRSFAPPTALPIGDASSGGGAQHPSGAGGTRSPDGPPTAESSASPLPSTPPGTHAECRDAAVDRTLDLAICLAGGG